MEDDDKTVISRRASRVRPGTRLNGIYQIDALIGFGGMSEIYRGHNIQTSDEVAIKVILPEFANDEQMVSLFRREALILNRLSHESIVRYHVFSHDPTVDLLYLAMEFVNGPTLRERIKQRPLSQIEACRLVARVASGMRTAHGEGIVHRDLSTDNIILVGGDVGRPKVIDFGIARAGDGSDGTLIQSGFAGKYNYVSPEQIGLFGGHVGATSDIYSLGLVFAAALLGKPLDMAGSHAEVVMKRQSVPDLSLVNPGVKPLIERMLQPNPAHRPQSMDDVVMALDMAIGQRRDATHPGIAVHPIRPRPVNLPKSPEPQKRRRAGIVALLILLAAAGAGWWATTQTEPGRGLVATLVRGNQSDSKSGVDVNGAQPLTPSGKSELKAGPDGQIERPPEQVEAGKGATETDAVAPLPGAQDPSAATDTPADIPDSGQTTVVEAEPVAAAAEAPERNSQPSDEAVTVESRPDAARIALADPDQASPTEETATTDAPAVGPAEWIAAFQGGDCYFARSTRVAANDVSIEGFGRSSEPFQDMEQRFRLAFGFEPSIGVRAVTKAQCPVIDFVRATAEPGEKMRIALPTDLIGENGSLSARISGITQGHVALFLATPGGSLTNVTSQARRDGNEVTLDIPAENLAAKDGGAYLLWTVASSKPLEVLDTQSADDAATYLGELAKAASAEGAMLSQALEYFRRQ